MCALVLLDILEIALKSKHIYIYLGGGFKYVSGSFSSLLAEMIQFDSYFSNGLKPPTRKHLSKTSRPAIQRSPFNQTGFGSLIEGQASGWFFF